MPRGNNRKDPIGNSCNMTSRHVTIDAESNCILCDCDGWLPIPVGKVSDFNSLEEIWNSPVAKMLQDDIDQKKFTWCAVEHCGVISKDINKRRYSININIDDSCNLACPSCRRELRMINSGVEYDKKIIDVNQILSWLTKFNDPITISLGGSGDALASNILRKLIREYVSKPGQQFKITTNGLLIKKIIAESKILPNISMLSISVDAASALVYEQVRRPGKWEILLENLHWVAENNLPTVLNFVVQKTNFKEILEFDRLCTQLNFTGHVQPLNDWGTWNSTPVINPDAYTVTNGTYLDHDVANPMHPEHMEFLTVLQNAREQNKSLKISSYFDKFK
jgi:sulfatase maturation enzyme AslB (radical SAM superfamily)